MNIGILCDPTLSSFNVKTLEPILNDKQFHTKVALLDARPDPGRWKTLKKNLKRGRGGYTVVMAIKKWFIQYEETIRAAKYFEDRDIDTWKVSDLYEKKLINKLSELNLDILLLAGGFGILKKTVLDVPKQGVLSYHHGNIRKYRGMPYGFWELYHGEKEMGVTVQKLSAGIDTGIPFVEKTISIEKITSIAKLQKIALKESEKMLYRALLQLKIGDEQTQPLDSYGELFTQPNFREWLMFQFKMIRKKLSLKLHRN